MLSAMPAALISGSQIVRGHFRRRHEDALFAAMVSRRRREENTFTMGVLLGFRTAEIFQIMFGKDLREDVRDLSEART